MNLNLLPYYMVRCLVCTIILEIIIAFILGVRNKRDLLNIVLVQVLTNPVVVSVPILIFILYGFRPYRVVFYSLEVITVIVEGFIYYKVLDYKKLNPFLLSLILNLGSYLIGEVINYIW